MMIFGDSLFLCLYWETFSWTIMAAENKTPSLVQAIVDGLPGDFPKVLQVLIIKSSTFCCGCSERLGFPIVDHDNACDDCKSAGVLHSDEECACSSYTHEGKTLCYYHLHNGSEIEERDTAPCKWGIDCYMCVANSQ